MVAFGAHSAKNGTILCSNAQIFLFKMRAKRVEILNFAQIFVKIVRRNIKFKF